VCTSVVCVRKLCVYECCVCKRNVCVRVLCVRVLCVYESRLLQKYRSLLQNIVSFYLKKRPMFLRSQEALLSVTQSCPLTS